MKQPFTIVRMKEKAFDELGHRFYNFLPRLGTLTHLTVAENSDAFL